MKPELYKKTALILFFLLFLIGFKTYAQERNLSKASFGFQLQQVHNDIGFGLHVLSPSFFGNFKLKNSYNINYLTHLNDDGLSSWTSYSHFNFGTRYYSKISSSINLYIEAGSQMLISPESISTEKMNFGGYGLFGFEFFLNGNTNSKTSYFIELGATGNNSRADNVASKPKIANGFVTSVGVRF